MSTIFWKWFFWSSNEKRIAGVLFVFFTVEKKYKKPDESF